MKILALESSATACSVALCEDERLIAQTFQNSGLTHSCTLMPMAESMLAQCGHRLSDVDVIAVAAGPGSFTGLRIGVSTAKGLAWTGDKPCAPCSTLESMAWQLAHMDGIIIAAMDARRNQVYNAVFRARNGRLERLSPDRAISLAELEEEIKKLEEVKILVGDGAQLCYNEWQERIADLLLSNCVHRRHGVLPRRRWNWLETMDWLPVSSWFRCTTVCLRQNGSDLQKSKTKNKYKGVSYDE